MLERKNTIGFLSSLGRRSVPDGMKELRTLSFFFLFSLILLSCQDSQRIDIAGSSTCLPVASKAAEQFSRKKEVEIAVNGGGSGVGIQKLGSGRVDIGMSSRSLTEEERESYPDTEFQTQVIAKDILLPAVSKEVHEEGVRTIRMEELRRILKGRVENWKALGGPDRKILFVDKEASRGTRHVYMEALFGNPKAQAPGADLVLGSNNEERTSISQSDAAIGIVSSAWVKGDLKGLHLIDEEGDTLSKEPEKLAGSKYPFARELLFLTDGEPKGSVKEFIDFVLSAPAQRIVKNAGYVSVQG
jgi:phosphate transport system substrate-binding protein